MRRNALHRSLIGPAAVLLALCLAPGKGAWGQEGPLEGGREVAGLGYATPMQPADLEDPGGNVLSEENAHDPSKGALFDGIDHYELLQGGQHDNKTRWASSDYIRWAVHAATLMAWGKIHDTDPNDATIATSEAWGAQVTEAVVSRSEGSHGTIRAENRISFGYHYLISGAYIAEASVQLDGTARDIKGREHVLHVNETSGEAVGTGTHDKKGLETTEYGKLRAFFSNKPGGDSLMVEAGGETTEYSELNVSVERSLVSSSGDNGSSPAVILSDEVCGATPLKRTYRVFSEGAVTLRARCGTIPSDSSDTSVTQPSVVVHLQRFLIRNTLHVWTLAVGDPVTPEDPEPEPRSPNEPWTPDDDPDGPITPGPDDAPATPGEPEPQPEPDGGSGGGGFRNQPSCTRVLPVPGTEPGEEPWEARISLFTPLGLVSEPGSLAGRLSIRLAAPASRDRAFLVEERSDNAAVLATAEPVVVPAGAGSATLPLHARREGTVTLRVQPLDASGAALGAPAELESEFASVARLARPEIWACVPGKSWSPGRGCAVRALTGERVGPLRVGRTGFSGFADESTVVTLAADDPDGILCSLPSSVAIEPGQLSVEVPLELRDEEGFASILLASGDRTVVVSVRAVRQSWTAPELVRVPLGAVGIVPYEFARSQGSVREVRATVEDPSLLVIEEDDGVDSLPPERRAWFFRVRARGSGDTRVRLESPGLPDLAVAIRVEPARLMIEPGALRLLQLDPSREGRIDLWTPEGVRFAGLAVPLELQESIRVEGLGTSLVTLHFLPSPDLPEEVTLPLAFEGRSATPIEIGVLDLLDLAASESNLVSYHLSVP